MLSTSGLYFDLGPMPRIERKKELLLILLIQVNLDYNLFFLYNNIHEPIDQRYDKIVTYCYKIMNFKNMGFYEQFHVQKLVLV